MMRIFRICFLSNFQIFHKVLLTVVVMLYGTSLVCIYLITGRLCLMTTLTQFPRLSPSASGKCRSDLFFYQFGCFLF